MRYQCLSCDARFDLEADDDLRCPTCMRQHGIEPVADAGASGPSGNSKRWVWLGLLTAAVVATGGALYYWQQQPRVLTDEPPLRPLTAAEREGYLRGRGYEPEGGREARAAYAWIDLLEADDAATEFAQASVVEAADAEGKAGAIVHAIRSLAQVQTFRLRAGSEPRVADAPRKASEVLDALRDDGADHQLYPLEVAAFAVAALRTVDVPALLAEVHRFPDEKRPADPSGRLGYYAVGLLTDAGEARYFDPFGGRAVQPEGRDVTLLTDLQAMGAAVALDAFHRGSSPGAGSEAIDAAHAAIKLAPRSPTVRAARGMVLLASGGLEDGKRDLHAALQLRSDGPRRLQVAALHIAQGEVDRAAREVARALDEFPEDAAGHAALASIYLTKREHARARLSLERSEELDPDLAVLPILWANLHMVQGDLEAARRRAEEAVERRPQDIQGRLLLGRLYRELNRYDDMRRQARAALEHVPRAQRDEMKRTLLAALGPTALDDPLDEQDAPDEDGPSLPSVPSDTFQLESEMLDGPSPDVGAPAPQGDMAPEGGDHDPLLMLGDPSKLKLRDDRLQLKLEP